MFQRYRLGYQLLLALAAAEFLIAFSFGTAPYSTYISTSGFISRMLPAWVMIPLFWAGFMSVEITRRKVDRPFSAIRRMLNRHRHWLLRGCLFMIVILFLARAFTSYKSAIPNIVPFYADPWLADLDRAIFGTDPWRITHAVIGPFGTMLIDRVYALWFVIMMLYVGWFCFTRNQVLQLRGLLTYLIAWALLGNVLATSMASVGPCFYDYFYHDPQFEPLMQTLRAGDEENRLFALGAMRFLMDSLGKDRFGAGISAMPSLHVSIAFLCFLVAREYAQHLVFKVLAFVFFLTILVGSVHLGWHYAADGIAGVLGVGLIWWWTGRFIAWLERREAALAADCPAPVPAAA